MFVLENGDKIQGYASAATVVDFHISGLTGTTLKNLADGQLPVSIGDLYTSSGTDLAKTIVLTNTDSVARTINLYHTPSSGTARRILPKDMSIAAGGTILFDGENVSVLSSDGGLVSSVSISDGSVTIEKIEDIATDSFLGRDTAGSGAVEIISKSAALTILNAEDGATADQTGAEIKSSYEGESNTNAFTDAQQTIVGNTSNTNTGDELAASLTVAGVVELATIAEVNTGTDATRAVTPDSLEGSALQIKVDAITGTNTGDEADSSATVKGIVELATITEVNTGSDTVRAITPAGLAGSALQTTADAAIASVVADTTPQLGGPLDLNEFNIEHIAAPSSDHKVSGSTVTLTAGENVAFGDVCYFKSDGKAWKADASAISTAPATYLAAAVISADAAGVFLRDGFARDDTWSWTVGGKIYLSETAGAFTQTAPTTASSVTQVLGVATHADRIDFRPSLDTLVHA